MRDHDSSWRQGGTYLAVFAGGALAGAVLALLLAPRTGEETRRGLGRAARSLAPRLRGALDEVASRTTGVPLKVEG